MNNNSLDFLEMDTTSHNFFYARQYPNDNRLIPIVINSCIKNLEFQCSSGKQYRDFLYVDDFIELTFLVLIVIRFLVILIIIPFL